MEVIAVISIAILLVLALAATVYIRRYLLIRAGAIEMSVRLDVRGRYGWGWAFGVARYHGDELQWFRIFSLSPRPKRSFRRTSLEIIQRRAPEGPETLALLSGAVVLSCVDRGRRVEVAMAPTALTGFLSWLESAAPGLPYLAEHRGQLNGHQHGRQAS